MDNEVREIMDDGAVIGYRPKLEYVKNKSGDDGTINQNSAVQIDKNSKNLYTNALKGIMNNLPSKALDDIDFAIQSMEDLIKELSTHFKDNKTEKYNKISFLITAFNNGNEGYINDFIEYHFSNPSSSIVPELMEIVYRTKTRLEELTKTLKYLYYGNENMALEEAKKQDEAIIEQLKLYEQTDKQKINYFAISTDAIFNRSASIYAFEANRHCMNIANIVNNKTSINTDKAQLEIIQYMYDESNVEITRRKKQYDSQQDIEIMKKTLYNYYNKRSSFNLMYDIFAENYSEEFALNSKLLEYQDNIDKALANVNRSYSGNQTYLSKLETLETQKAQIMQIYSNKTNNL